MADPGEPVDDAGALLGDLLQDSGPSVADDVVVALHLVPSPIRPGAAAVPGLSKVQGDELLAYTVPRLRRVIPLAKETGLAGGDLRAARADRAVRSAT
jgi:hypothetical protein